MLTLTPTTNYNTIKEIIFDPKLYKVTYGNDVNKNDFKVDKTFKYLLIKNDNELIGAFMVRPISNATLECHSLILSKFWGTTIVDEATASGHKWVKQQGYLKIFIKIPAICVHVLRHVQSYGYKCCGMVEKGIIFNNILCSLFFYELEV